METNWIGCWALFVKEVRRFYSVAVQTVFAPVVSSLLYLLIFGQVIDTKIEVFSGLSYSQFLIPGLVMMTIILQAVGLPLEGVGIVLAVDRILDMFRTATNVLSDSCGTVIIARTEGETLDRMGEPAD